MVSGYGARGLVLQEMTARLFHVSDHSLLAFPPVRQCRLCTTDGGIATDRRGSFCGHEVSFCGLAGCAERGRTRCASGARHEKGSGRCREAATGK